MGLPGHAQAQGRGLTTTLTIYRWRERLEAPLAPVAFLPVSLAPEPASPSPAPVLDETSGDRDPALRLDRSPRVEIVLSAGRRIIVEAGADTEVSLGT